MNVRCYNCGRPSPDKEDWELTKLGWSANSGWMSGEDFFRKGYKAKNNWFCPDCFVVNMDTVFNLPIRVLGRRN